MCEQGSHDGVTRADGVLDGDGDRGDVDTQVACFEGDTVGATGDHACGNIGVAEEVHLLFGKFQQRDARQERMQEVAVSISGVEVSDIGVKRDKRSARRKAMQQGGVPGRAGFKSE